MNFVLAASCLVLLPGLVSAEPRCSLPLPPTAASPKAEAASPNPLQPPSVAVAQEAQPGPTMALPASASATAPTADSLILPPSLKHIAAAGAAISDMGEYHGLHRVIARTGDQFMLLSATPDGQAVVAGLMSDLSAAELSRLAGGGLTELGILHGLRGLLVRSGSQFQVFYATPDGTRVIPGVMWDATGRNLTREQINPIAGAVPTVTIGPVVNTGGQSSTPSSTGTPQAVSLLNIVQTTSFGTTGTPAAPRLWMFIDPLCAFSVRAMQQLQPLVSSGRVQLAVIPLAIIDRETNGRSTTSALAMLSKPADQMIAAWSSGTLGGAPVPEAAARLQANMAAAQAIRLEGTPTLIWRKADGSEGRSDGLPGDLNAILASLGS